MNKMPEMKCHRDVKGRDALYKKLESRMQDEKQWVPSKRRYLSLGNGEVTFLERDHAIRGILNLTKMFKMFPETYAMAVNFADRFLAVIKVRAVHLHCVALTCVYVAVKLQEEQQYIPDINALMNAAVKTELRSPSYSPSDVLRMERKVLDKLEWDLNPVTPLTMLELYFAAACLDACLLPDENPNDELSMLTEQLEIALCYSSIAMYTPSIIALAIISLKLCDSSVWTDKLLPQFMEQTKSSHEDFYCCEELVEEMLYSVNSYEADNNLNGLPLLYRRDHSVTFAPMSLSQSSMSQSSMSPLSMSHSEMSHSALSHSSMSHPISPCPTSDDVSRKKPTYAAVLTQSLNDSMMSMSM